MHKANDLYIRDGHKANSSTQEGSTNPKRKKGTPHSDHEDHK